MFGVGVVAIIGVIVGVAGELEGMVACCPWKEGFFPPGVGGGVVSTHETLKGWCLMAKKKCLTLFLFALLMVSGVLSVFGGGSVRAAESYGLLAKGVKLDDPNFVIDDLESTQFTTCSVSELTEVKSVWDFVHGRVWNNIYTFKEWIVLNNTGVYSWNFIYADVQILDGENNTVDVEYTVYWQLWDRDTVENSFTADKDLSTISDLGYVLHSCSGVYFDSPGSTSGTVNFVALDYDADAYEHFQKTLAINYTFLSNTEYALKPVFFFDHLPDPGNYTIKYKIQLFDSYDSYLALAGGGTRAVASDTVEGEGTLSIEPTLSFDVLYGGADMDRVYIEAMLPATTLDSVNSLIIKNTGNVDIDALSFTVKDKTHNDETYGTFYFENNTKIKRSAEASYNLLGPDYNFSFSAFAPGEERSFDFEVINWDIDSVYQEYWDVTAWGSGLSYLGQYFVRVSRYTGTYDATLTYNSNDHFIFPSMSPDSTNVWTENIATVSLTDDSEDSYYIDRMEIVVSPIRHNTYIDDYIDMGTFGQINITNTGQVFNLEPYTDLGAGYGRLLLYTTEDLGLSSPDSISFKIGLKTVPDGLHAGDYSFNFTVMIAYNPVCELSGVGGTKYDLQISDYTLNIEPTTQKYVDGHFIYTDTYEIGDVVVLNCNVTYQDVAIQPFNYEVLKDGVVVASGSFENSTPLSTASIPAYMKYNPSDCPTFKPSAAGVYTYKVYMIGLDGTEHNGTTTFTVSEVENPPLIIAGREIGLKEIAVVLIAGLSVASSIAMLTVAHKHKKRYRKLFGGLFALLFVSLIFYPAATVQGAGVSLVDLDGGIADVDSIRFNYTDGGVEHVFNYSLISDVLKVKAAEPGAVNVSDDFPMGTFGFLPDQLNDTLQNAYDSIYPYLKMIFDVVYPVIVRIYGYIYDPWEYPNLLIGTSVIGSFSDLIKYIGDTIEHYAQDHNLTHDFYIMNVTLPWVGSLPIVYNWFPLETLCIIMLIFARAVETIVSEFYTWDGLRVGDTVYYDPGAVTLMLNNLTAQFKVVVHEWTAFVGYRGGNGTQTIFNKPIWRNNTLYDYNGFFTEAGTYLSLGRNSFGFDVWKTTTDQIGGDFSMVRNGLFGVISLQTAVNWWLYFFQGDYTVYVVDKSGKAVDGAVVEVSALDHDYTKTATTTNGKASFSLPRGAYRVTVTYEGENYTSSGKVYFLDSTSTTVVVNSPDHEIAIRKGLYYAGIGFLTLFGVFGLVYFSQRHKRRSRHHKNNIWG